MKNKAAAPASQIGSSLILVTISTILSTFLIPSTGSSFSSSCPLNIFSLQGYLLALPSSIFMYLARHTATILQPMNLKYILSTGLQHLNNRFAFLMPCRHHGRSSCPGIQMMPDSSTTQWMASPLSKMIKIWELLLASLFASTAGFEIVIKSLSFLLPKYIVNLSMFFHLNFHHPDPKCCCFSPKLF